jgi:hypothetical protein
MKRFQEARQIRLDADLGWDWQKPLARSSRMGHFSPEEARWQAAGQQRQWSNSAILLKGRDTGGNHVESCDFQVILCEDMLRILQAIGPGLRVPTYRLSGLESALLSLDDLCAPYK